MASPTYSGTRSLTSTPRMPRAFLPSFSPTEVTKLFPVSHSTSGSGPGAVLNVVFLLSATLHRDLEVQAVAERLLAPEQNLLQGDLPPLLLQGVISPQQVNIYLLFISTISNLKYYHPVIRLTCHPVMQSWSSLLFI